MRTQHTVHVGYCTCGKVVRGNGGKAGHAYMHERKQDGHHFTGKDHFHRMFPEQFPGLPVPPAPFKKTWKYEVVNGKIRRVPK